MLSVINEELQKLIKQKTRPHKRDAYIDLINTIESNDEKVTIIHGLRRTGKTVMMIQAMEELGYENCLYLYCDSPKTEGEKIISFDCLSDVTNEIRKNKKKYVFIDEATRLYDFIGGIPVLPDLWVSKDCRIILSGTESFGFVLSKEYGDLNDRANFIYTTYISFQEWHNILGKNIKEYIRYGGTLSPENTFYNDEVSKEYLDTAIVNNFLHPLEHLGREKAPKLIYKAFVNNELETYIQRIIEMSNEKFMIGDKDSSDLGDFEYLKDDFTYKSSHILGDLQDILTRRGYNTRPFLENQEQIIKSFRQALRIHNHSDLLETNLDNGLVRELLKYMKEINMIEKKAKDSYYFVQPGLRYSQCKMLIESLELSETDKKYSKADWHDIKEIFKTIVEGRILEDIVFSDLLKKEGCTLDVFKYSKTKEEGTAGEFDAVVVDYNNRTAYIYEVKNSSEMVDNQAKNLLSENFCKEFENEIGVSIIYKAVIYNGKTCHDLNVHYLNAEEFLTNHIGRMIQNIFIQDKNVKISNNIDGNECGDDGNQGGLGSLDDIDNKPLNNNSETLSTPSTSKLNIQNSNYVGNESKNSDSPISSKNTIKMELDNDIGQYNKENEDDDYTRY